ncbi:MAG: discoidin domain-containing protein [Cetobacterium sp.]
MYQELIYKFDFSRFKVAKEIELQTDGRVVNATLKTEDSFGNTIVNELKNIEILDGKNILKFDLFYGDSCELTIFGEEISYENIDDIKVREIDQLPFVAGADAPNEHMLERAMDKTKMIATSNCSSVGDNTCDKALDGNLNTYFLSQSYSESQSGDFVVDLGETSLINEIEFTTNSDNDGKIKSYTILYKSFSADSWKEIHSSINDEVLKKSVTFNTILAKELCIRVKESGANSIYISEIGVYKYSSLKDEIYGLFTDEDRDELASDVTQEMIVDLQERVIYTEDYMRLLELASDLYIEKYSLSPKIIKIPLKDEAVVKRVSFKASRDMIKSTLKYTDSLGVKRVKRLYWYIENKIDGVITIGVEEFAGKLRVHTDDIELLVYGTTDAELVSFETFPIESFSLKEEMDNKIDLSTSFFSEKYPDDTLIMKKEYLIDEIRLLTDEEVKVFIKDIGRSTRLSWDEVAEVQEYIEIGKIENNSLKLPNRYFTTEIKLKSESGKSYINGIEVYQYNSIGEEVEGLFKDSTYKELKETVTFEQILDVESRVKVDGKYIDKVKLAKSLFIQNSFTEEIKFEFSSERVFNQIKFVTLEQPYRVDLVYENPTGDILRKNCDFTIDDEEVTVSFPKIHAVNAKMQVSGLERLYKPKANSFSMSSYVVENDSNEEFKVLENISEVEVKQNGSYTDYFISLNKEELIYKFKSLTRANIFVKDLLSGNYIEFKEDDGILKSKAGYLIKDFIYRVYNNLAKESVLETLKAYKKSKVKIAIDNLFLDSTCTKLSDFVTLDYILDLEKMIVSSNEYRLKINIAKSLFINDTTYLEEMVETNPNMAISKLILNFTENVENIFEYQLYTKNVFGEEIEIIDYTIENFDDMKEIHLSFDEIFAQSLKVVLKISEAEIWKFAVAYEEYKELNTK